MVTDLLLVSGSLAFFWLCSWLFLYSVLFSKYEARQRGVQLLFALVLTDSCLMYESVLFDIIGVTAQSTRKLLLETTLAVLCALILVVIPLYGLCLFAFGQNSSVRAVLSGKGHVRLSALLCSALRRSLIIALQLSLAYALYTWILAPIGLALSNTISFFDANNNDSLESPNTSAKRHTATASESESASVLSLEYVVSMVGALSVTLMSALSAVGAITYPYYWLSFFRYYSMDDALANLDDELLSLARTIKNECIPRIFHSKKKILSLQKEVNYLESQSSRTSSPSDTLLLPKKHKSSSSLIGTTLGVVRSVWRMPWKVSNYWQSIQKRRTLRQSVSRRQMTLANEKRVLEGNLGMYRSMLSDYTRLSEWKADITESQTLKGKMKNVLGYVMAAYCIYRVTSALFYVLLRRQRKIDPITRIFSILSKILPESKMLSDDEIHFISQQLAFIWVGIIVATQIRGILVRVLRFLDYLNSVLVFDWLKLSVFGAGVGGNGALVVLFLTEMMALYFVSGLLILRLYLPPEYRRFLTANVGPGLDFQAYYKDYDTVYIISVVISLTVVVVAFCYRRFRFTQGYSRIGPSPKIHGS